MPQLTAETITDADIRALQGTKLTEQQQLDCERALSKTYRTTTRTERTLRKSARARCAALINARARGARVQLAMRYHNDEAEARVERYGSTMHHADSIEYERIKPIAGREVEEVNRAAGKEPK